MAAEISSSFEIVVSKILKSWDVLQHAVDGGFGGVRSKEKAQWLEGVIVDYFNQNSDLESFEVEQFIAEIMDNEFSLLIEDNSLSNVSRNLCRCYDWTKKGDSAKVKDFVSTLKVVERTSVQVQKEKDDADSSDDSESDDDEKANLEEAMEIDNSSNNRIITDKSTKKSSVPASQQVDEDDGWTFVTHKKK